MDNKIVENTVEDNARILMTTEHLVVYLTQPYDEIEVCINGNKQFTFVDNEIMLYPKDASSVSIEEIKSLPFKVGIVLKEFEINPDRLSITNFGKHHITISQYLPDSLEVSFEIWGPLESKQITDSFSDDEYYNETTDYRLEFFNLVKNNKQFQIPKYSENFGTFNAEFQKLADSKPNTKYRPYAYFAFFTTIKAKTFDELASQALKISQELDQKSKYAVLAKKGFQ